MTNAIGMLDFFVLEAGEYLERLDALAQTAPGPFDPVDEFVRITRALRGGALMASQQPLARAAQGLEAAGRAVRDGRLAWDERTRGEVIRAVDDCKILLRRVRTPAATMPRRPRRSAPSWSGWRGGRPRRDAWWARGSTPGRGRSSRARPPPSRARSIGRRAPWKWIGPVARRC